MKNKFKAFTLAEIMIVLTVIGILVAILLPSAQNAIPKEDMMKFKKVNNNLAWAINELVTSEKYYSDGDLGLKANGSLVDSPKYFCNTLADVLTTKSVNCLDTNLGYNSSAVANLPDILIDDIDGAKIYEYVDCMCSKNVPLQSEIVLADNTEIYTINPYWHFGSKTNTGSADEKRLFNLCSNQKRYKFICVDIDGLNQGEAPFGYALRADGKIIYGAKANAWIKASIQAKDDEDELTIATLDSCSPTALSIVPENDVCKSAAPAPGPSPEPEPEPEPEKECPELAMKVNLNGTDYCVTKYNIGDKTNLVIPNTVTTIQAGSVTCDALTDKCCWKGETSSYCDANNGGYSGCNRIVCNWNAANEICSKLEYGERAWSLMSEEQLSALKNLGFETISKGLGAAGLQFCDSHSGHSSAVCLASLLCYGADSQYCQPYAFWGAANGGNSFYMSVMTGNMLGPHSNITSAAYSVRCIAEL